MNRNIILSGPQVTIDHTFMVPDHFEDICREFLAQGFFRDHPNALEVLESIATFGLRQDYNERIKKDVGPLARARQFLLDRYPGTSERVQLGGNPAIAAQQGHLLCRGNGDRWPIWRYMGLLPESLRDHLQQQEKVAPQNHAVLTQLFDKKLCVEIAERPMTLALEAHHHKLIIAYAEGRTLNYINSNGHFSRYIRKLKTSVAANEAQNVLFAFTAVPHPLEFAGPLIDQIKEHFGDRALFYIGGSSFRRGATLDSDITGQIWRTVLSRADILSLNETELGDLHTVVVGGGTYQEKPLAIKLLELPTRAIKVCHGADGALMDPGPDPGRILNAEAFRNYPAAFLKESLGLAGDGASYCLGSLYGKDATLSSVQIYSETVQNRNIERFKAVFLNVLESLPAGLIAVHGPVVSRPMATLTGVGARFDGLLASFLMRS